MKTAFTGDLETYRPHENGPETQGFRAVFYYRLVEGFRLPELPDSTSQ